MELTSKQRAQLRGMAANLDTIVHVGKDGIGENLIKQVNDALEARELIKGRVLENSLLSPREAAQRNLEICQSFARDFRPGKQNLLLFGAPGLGKTFLSACIARVVSEDGFSVVYDTAGHIFSQFEAAKFRRDDVDEPDESVERCMACDLLILDDLGAEFATAYSQSVLYQVINDRMTEGRATIISTNCSNEELQKKYTPQILSRIAGEYQTLPFAGRDIRQIKKEREA